MPGLRETLPQQNTLKQQICLYRRQLPLVALTVCLTGVYLWLFDEEERGYLKNVTPPSPHPLG